VGGGVAVVLDQFIRNREFFEKPDYALGLRVLQTLDGSCREGGERTYIEVVKGGFVVCHFESFCLRVTKLQRLT